MKRFILKLIAAISMLFFSNIYSQNKDSLVDIREVNAFKEKLELYFQKQKQEILRLKSLGKKEFISENGNEKQLIGADEEGRAMYYTTLNAGASKMTKAQSLYAGGGLGLSISGQGMVIGQWDYAKPRTTHETLINKISYAPNQNSTITRHSTNIAATMVGNNGDANARGISYDAILRAYDWSNDVSEMTNEAFHPTSNTSGVLVANNSYGFDPMYLQQYQFGKYNTTAQMWDNLMYIRPYLQIVKAAGNARELNASIVPQVAAKGGYDLLEGAGVAKNVLVIASAKKNTNMSSDEDFQVSSFSSYGPTDDGRIKPDLCSPGEEMYSAIETYDSAYGTYKGTSSATAVVSGAIALLQQYYKSVSPSSNYMQSASVRALLVHTANDKGTEGPDYIYGWGMIDAKRAASAIYNNIEGTTNNEKKTTLIKELTLNQGNKHTFYVVPFDLSQPLSATISWTDPQGQLVNNTIDLSNPNIVNDLDLKIVKVNSNGSETTYYPWKLGGMSNVAAAAVQDVNSVDTIERVDIKNPAKVTYKIIISPKSISTPLLPSGFQNFSIIITNVDFCYMDDLKVLTSPTNDISSQQIIKAKKIIASNKVVAPTQGVEYIASKEISLIPGFHAQSGSGFRAYITPCFDLVSSMKYLAQQRSTTASIQPEVNSEEALLLFPNPATNETNIKFTLKRPSKVSIFVYDASGKIIFSNKSSEEFPAGGFIKTININGLTTGVYIVSVETNDFKESKKLIVK